MTDKQNLIDELQSLLKKHNASISWGCHFMDHEFIHYFFKKINVLSRIKNC
jgi:hypothetical protein